MNLWWYFGSFCQPAFLSLFRHQVVQSRAKLHLFLIAASLIVIGGSILALFLWQDRTPATATHTSEDLYERKVEDIAAFNDKYGKRFVSTSGMVNALSARSDGRMHLELVTGIDGDNEHEGNFCCWIPAENADTWRDILPFDHIHLSGRVLAHTDPWVDLTDCSLLSVAKG